MTDDSASVTMFGVTGGSRAVVSDSADGWEWNDRVRAGEWVTGRLLCWWVSCPGRGTHRAEVPPAGHQQRGACCRGSCLSGRSGAQRLYSARARPTWRRACSPSDAAPGSCSMGDVTHHLVRASAAAPLRRAAPVRTLQHTFTRNPSVLRYISSMPTIFRGWQL